MEEDPLVPLNRGPYASRPESTGATILNGNESEGNADIPNPNVGVQPKKKRKVVIDWECVNTECRVTGSRSRPAVPGIPLVKTASNYVIAFYGQMAKENGLTNGKNKNVDKKRKVCFACERKANQAQDKMFEALVSGDSIIKEKLFPSQKDVVLLEDSDEEPISDTSSESELELEFEIKEEVRNGATSLNILEKELEMVVSDTLRKLKVEEQIHDSIKIIGERLDNLQPDYEKTNTAFQQIENEVDRIREEFYQPFRPIPKFMEPLDLNKGDLEGIKQEDTFQHQISPSRTLPDPSPRSTLANSLALSSTIATDSLVFDSFAVLPSAGKLERPELKPDDKVYAVRGNILNVWKIGHVSEVISGLDAKYKVRFETLHNDKSVSSYVKVLSLKQLAYDSPASVRLQVGTRIIGIYNDNQLRDTSEPWSLANGDFYSGIVAEPPKAMNKHRYLVFFDDGYASYISHKHLRVVCKQTESNGAVSGVWDDIHPNSREFIKKYLMQYPERPMVRLIQGQIVRTEWEGSWWYTRVEEVDASLVKLTFHVNGRKESIYRGSTRLEPLYVEMQQQKKRAEQMNLNNQAGVEGVPGTPNLVSNRFMPRNRIEGFKKNRPYVEYTRQFDPDSPSQQDSQPVRRAVAKKSTASKRHQTDISYESTNDLNKGWDKKVSKRKKLRIFKLQKSSRMG